jgi:hypothetical protein
VYNQFFVMLATSTICHLAFRLGLLLIGLRSSRGYVCEPAAPELSPIRQLLRGYCRVAGYSFNESLSISRLMGRNQPRSVHRGFDAHKGSGSITMKLRAAGSRVGGILQGRIWSNPREKDFRTVNELVTDR